MSWLEEYRTALARTIVREGTPHKKTRDYYESPEDYGLNGQLNSHLAEDRRWSLASDPTEIWWTEFAGTFAPTDAGQRTGIQAEISCSCGKFRNVTVVVSNASFSSLLISMLKEEDE